MNNEFISILLVAVGLSADCFAVALCSGITRRNQSWLKVFPVALSFGIFHAVMPALGWLLGRTVMDHISGFDHWIAFALLAFVGGKLIYESLRRSNDGDKPTDIASGLMLITVSFATSIDALAVGLSFALIDVNIGVASPVIGLVAMTITGAGFVVGKQAGKLVGKRAKTVGGLILLAIAARILISHYL
jgi:putative Mn2+ efflux pump MntP